MPRKKEEHLKRRKDGRFCCKWNGMAFYSYTSDKEALALRDAAKAAAQTGFSPNTTVSEYALPWLKRTFPEVAETTYTGLAIHLQHLIDEIGEKRVAAIVPSDIKGIYSNQYKGRSNSYLKSAKQLYCSLFDSAVADGLLRMNPARDRTAKPHKGKDVKTRPITEQEREWINTLCKDHRAFPAVITMLYAGIRPQEAKALDISKAYDEEAGLLHITETAHRDGCNNYEITEKGKTDNANRDIPVFPPVAEVLKGKTGLLITTAKGKQITKSAWVKAFSSYKYSMESAINGCRREWYGRTREHKAILERGEALPPWIEFTVIPYDLRHSFCTMCRDAGVEINTCIKWMGHADANMILKVYDSVSKNRTETERQKVEKVVFGVQPEVQPEKTEPETVDK